MQHGDKVAYDGDHKQRTEEIKVDPFTALALEEADHDIKYRTLSWQKTALLLFGEYVCLAILALAWSWSVLGWVNFVPFRSGARADASNRFAVTSSLLVWVSLLGVSGERVTALAVADHHADTSYILWEFCMRHPEARDICDIAAILFVSALI